MKAIRLIALLFVLSLLVGCEPEYGYDGTPQFRPCYDTYIHAKYAIDMTYLNTHIDPPINDTTLADTMPMYRHRISLDSLGNVYKDCLGQ